MPVTIIAEETVIKDQENLIKLQEYDYPIVLESGGKYTGIESDGQYKVFEKGVVRSLINPTACISYPENISNTSISNNIDDSMSIKLERLNKPVRNVLRVLTGDYSIIHGNTQSVAKEK